MIKWIRALAMGLSLCLALSLCGFAGECEEIRGRVLRLHVLANSDTEEDQALKLKVRDRIIAEAPYIFTDSMTLDEVKNTAKENLSLLQKTAEDEIRKNGYSYPVKCEIVNMYFETREYEDFTMPAGYYDALRIEIGKAEGHNWWCVMFPPMCLPAAQSDTDTQKVVKEYRDEHEIVNEKPQYEIKFAVVELFEKIMA